jgi:undecaprenyl-diphosphatase
MKKEKNIRIIFAGAALLALFIVWTVLVKCVDVQAIGPNGSAVGFAALNGFVHKLTGANMVLYNITDWLGIVPICFAAAFGVLGFTQLIKRKRLLSVDASILVLGVFYIVVIAIFVFFEVCVVNYRPVLIEGVMEASYPSSTTLLVTCVMPTAAMQLKERITGLKAQRACSYIIYAFSVFMVLARLISGVHWFTDIAGGALLCAALVMLYRSAVLYFAEKQA